MAETDAHRLKATMVRLGFRNIDLAKRVGVTPDSVSRWLCQGVPVPGPVWAYLELYEKMKGFQARVQNIIAGVSP